MERVEGGGRTKGWRRRMGKEEKKGGGTKERFMAPTWWSRKGKERRFSAAKIYWYDSPGKRSVCVCVWMLWIALSFFSLRTLFPQGYRKQNRHLLHQVAS